MVICDVVYYVGVLNDKKFVKLLKCIIFESSNIVFNLYKNWVGFVLN